MSKKPIIITIVILLLAIVGVWGYQYVKDMPQVSQNDSEKLLSEYKDDLHDLYVELNNTYNGLAAENRQAEWETFSKDWVPRLLNVRSETLEKRLPEQYENTKAMLMAAQNSFLPLWAEYNKDFIGENSNDSKIEELKNRIENILKNVNI